MMGWILSSPMYVLQWRGGIAFSLRLVGNGHVIYGLKLNIKRSGKGEAFCRFD